VEDWSNPREYELPEAFRGPEGIGLARAVVGARLEEGGPLRARLEGLEFKVPISAILFLVVFGADDVCVLTGRQPLFVFKFGIANYKRSIG
jgi:hypothetical protein